MGRAHRAAPERVFLFDEPLSNLDAALRAEVRVEIKRLHADLGATIDLRHARPGRGDDARGRLVVLPRAGRAGGAAARGLSRARASRFVASFMGSPAMNFVDAASRSDGRAARGGARDLPDARRSTRRRAVVVGIRPHDVVPGAEPRPRIALDVDVVETMGFEAYAHGHVGEAPFVARVEGERAGSVAPATSRARRDRRRRTPVRARLGPRAERLRRTGARETTRRSYCAPRDRIAGRVALRRVAVAAQERDDRAVARVQRRRGRGASRPP